MGKKQDFLGLELENDQASQLRVIRVIDSLRNKTNSDLLLVIESQMCVYAHKNTDANMIILKTTRKIHTVLANTRLYEDHLSCFKFILLTEEKSWG